MKNILEFQVRLAEISPVIWRRFELRAEGTFWHLHCALQDVMPWRDAHLHEFQFATGDMAARIGIVALDPEEVGAHESLMSWQTPLLDWFVTIPSSCEYLYDFGDSWDHVIKLEKWFDNTPTDGLPFLLEAAGRCPPEDIGGAPGYAEYLDAIGDPVHPEHEHMRLGRPEHFDPNVIDSKALEAAVNALSEKWMPRRRVTRSK